MPACKSANDSGGTSVMREISSLAHVIDLNEGVASGSSVTFEGFPALDEGRRRGSSREWGTGVSALS